MLKPSCRKSRSGLCTRTQYNLYIISIYAYVIDLFIVVGFITWSSILYAYVFGRLLRKLLREIYVYDSNEGLRPTTRFVQ